MYSRDLIIRSDAEHAPHIARPCDIAPPDGTAGIYGKIGVDILEKGQSVVVIERLMGVKDD